MTSAEDSAGTGLNLGSNTCCICELGQVSELVNCGFLIKHQDNLSLSENIMNFKKNVSVLAAIALMASSLVGCSDDPNVIATVGSSKITTEMLQKEVDLTRLMYKDTIKKSESVA